MAAAESHLRFGDYLELLKVFGERDAEALVVGGQAVNFWAEAFEEQEPEIQRYRPYTSADLDLHAVDASVQRLLRAKATNVEPRRDPFGKAFTIVTHTFLIRSVDGRNLRVHDLKMVAGLRPAELKKGALTVESAGVRFRVLNPIACLKAKLHNVAAFDQHGRQDEKHVRILIPCIRAFVRRLLAEAQASGNYRPVVNALNQVVECTSSRSALRTARTLHFPLSKSLPVRELEASQQIKLVNFASQQLPKWSQLMGRLS